MKQFRMTMAAWLLIAIGLSIAPSLATTMAVYDCPLCMEKQQTGGGTCIRCGFISFGPIRSLSDKDREHIRRFMASERYQAIRSEPIEERIRALYPEVPMPIAQKANFLFWIAASSVVPPPSQQLWEDTLSALRQAEKEPLSESEHTARALRTVVTLRRMGRFDEALGCLKAIATNGTPLRDDQQILVRRERDMIELKSTHPPPGWELPPGTLAAKASTTGNPVFGREVNQTPTILSAPSGAKYPLAMRYAGINGEVTVAISVLADGTVDDVKLLKATQPEFVEAALAFARSCRLDRVIQNEKPIPYECTVAVVFSLNEQ